MTPEEQLINDILVIEEKIMYEKDYDNPQQSNINKLHARRLRAVEQYASTKAEEVAIEFCDFLSNEWAERFNAGQFNMPYKAPNEWYDQFKQQMI